MCRLYEKFILEYYRKEHPELKANSKEIDHKSYLLIKGKGLVESEIENLIKRQNPVELANLFTLVRENYSAIPSGILSKIETLCGVELRIDE